MEKTTILFYTFFCILIFMFFAFFYILPIIPLFIFFCFFMVRQEEIENKLLYKTSLIPLPFGIITLIILIAAMVDGYLPAYAYNGFHPAIDFYIVLSLSVYSLLFALINLIFIKQIVRHVKEKYSLTDEGAMVFLRDIHTKRQKEEIIEAYKRDNYR